MKRFFIVILLTAFAGSAMAQSPAAREKIESARIALISERLGLKPEQAEKFWPVYREFVNKRNDLRKEFRTQRGAVDIATATEEQKQRLIELRLELKQQELDLEKDYSSRLLNIISSQQILQLRKAEADFTRILLDRIQQQQRQRLQRDQLRDRRRNNIQRDRNNGN